MDLECSKHGVTGHRHSVENGRDRYRCKKCSDERVNAHRRKKKQWCIDYLGGKCQACGYNKFSGALEFHHRDPSQKEFQFSQYQRTTYERLKQELDKCDLLCSNCHKEAHGVLDGTL